MPIVVDKTLPDWQDWAPIRNPYPARPTCLVCHEIPCIVRRPTEATLQYKCPNEHVVEYDVDGEDLLDGRAL